MTDDADHAVEQEELDRQIALLNQKKPMPMTHRSHCLWCEEPLPPKHGWFCDADCRSDFDKKFSTIK